MKILVARTRVQFFELDVDDPNDKLSIMKEVNASELEEIDTDISYDECMSPDGETQYWEIEYA
jgi:hypothetical protein